MGTKSTKVKAKKGQQGTGSKKLDKVADYLAAQTTSTSGAKLAAEATDLKEKRDAYAGKRKLTVDKHAEALQAEIDEGTAEEQLDHAIDAYVRKGGIVAAGDATVLGSLAIDAADPRSPNVTGPAPVPTKLRLTEGYASGQSMFRWARPENTAAFVVQYKVEGEGLNAPATEWMPPDGHHTSKVEWLITGLPPAATVRGRVRAIGAEIGDWSDEAIGKAR